ncbi:MAG: hypothetical protein PHV85_04160 [Desulfovibrionaceae bacterium]|nr:hypothetical protein [Desulfovibrionaceae bacterium]
MARRPSILLPLAVFVAVFVAVLAFFVWRSERRQAELVDQPAAVQEAPAQQAPAKGEVFRVEPAGPEPESAPSAGLERPAEPGPKAEGPRVVVEDKVVGFSFLNHVARFAVERYCPAGPGEKGPIGAGFRALNMACGSDLAGLSFEGDDIRKARQMVLDYLFRPETLKAVYASYADLFLDDLAAAAEETEKTLADAQGVETRRVMNPAEVADMLRLYADKLDSWAEVFRTLARNPDIVRSVARYHQAARAVEAANSEYQERLSQAQDLAGEHTAESGQRLKQAIVKRERIRAGVVSALKDPKKTCAEPDNGLFYMAQWAYRRTGAEPEDLNTLDTASTLMADLADRMRARAEGLTAPAPAEP